MEMTIGNFQLKSDGNNHKNKVISEGGNDHKKWWFPGVEMTIPLKGGTFPFPPAVSLRGKVVVRKQARRLLPRCTMT